MEKGLRPLVAQMVQNGARETSPDLDTFMAEVASNGWFTYGRLLLAELAREGLIEERAADSLAVRLETSKMARESRLRILASRRPA